MRVTVSLSSATTISFSPFSPLTIITPGERGREGEGGREREREGWRKGERESGGRERGCS